jgi:hypothetical protein
MDLAKQGLNSLRNESGKVDEGNGMARLQVAAVGLAATVVALGVAMYKGVASTIELGARLVDVSYKSGLAVEEIMALERSLDEVGGKAEEAAPATDRFNQAIQQAANNAGPLVSVLKDAGISMESLAKMSVAERMTSVGDAIRAIANPAQQAEAAVAAFGASGVKMLAALDSKNLNSATAAMGSQAQIMQANAGVFARIMQLMGAQGSSLNSLAVAAKGKLQGLFTGIASGVAPTVLKIMEASATGGMSLAASIRAFSPALEPLATLVESLVNMDLAGVGAQLGAGAAAIGEAIMNGDAIAYIKNGLAIAGIDFKAALLTAGTSISEAFAKLKDFLDVPSIIEEMKAGLQAAGNSLVGVIQKGMASMLQTLRNSSDFLQKAISPETVLFLANQGAKTAKEASTAFKGLFSGEGKDFTGMLGISQNEQVAADEARKRNEEIEARSKKSAAKTAEDLRKQFATPAKGEQAITMKPAAAESPVGMIVSSLAKIGGDQGGSQQTGMLDIARSQLIAQQETAKNTAKIAEKMKTTSGSSDNAGSIYQ